MTTVDDFSQKFSDCIGEPYSQVPQVMKPFSRPAFTDNFPWKMASRSLCETTTKLEETRWLHGMSPFPFWSDGLLCPSLNSSPIRISQSAEYSQNTSMCLFLSLYMYALSGGVISSELALCLTIGRKMAPHPTPEHKP